MEETPQPEETDTMEYIILIAVLVPIAALFSHAERRLDAPPEEAKHGR